MLLNGYSEESPACVAQPIRQCIHWMIHVQQDLGDSTNVHDRFKESEGRREDAPTLNYGHGTNSVERDVGDSGQDDKPECDEYSRVHRAIDSDWNLSMRAAAEPSS